MRGGELHVEGDAGDWAGAGMHGGALVVHGSAGRRLGGAYPGERAGMRGGEIVVHGDAGAQAGAGLRRGLIAVAGRSARPPAFACSRERSSRSAGSGRGRGPACGAARSSRCRRPRRLRPSRSHCLSPAVPAAVPAPAARLGLAVSDEQLDGRYERWCGDGLELRRGEILILEEAHDAFAQRPARELADRLAADAEAAHVEVTTLSNGTRVIDCGAQAAGLRGGTLASPRSAWRGSGTSRTRRWSSKVAGCPRSR